MLDEAESRNPGPWVGHSVHVGRAARAIAEVHPDLDPDAAHVMGLLHDIGRGGGRSDLRHVLDGYRAMIEAGFDEVARICLTHSFPLPEVACYSGQLDCSDDDVAFLDRYLAETPQTDYDRLIQLADGLCLPTGFCLLEKRLVDVAMRYGTGPRTAATWRARFEAKARVEAAIGRSVYDLLPGVVENTFT